MPDPRGLINQQNRNLVPAGPPIGEMIEVIIRYRGVEYTGITGKLLEVRLDNDFERVPDEDGAYNRLELTGKSTLSLVVDRNV